MKNSNDTRVCSSVHRGARQQENGPKNSDDSARTQHCLHARMVHTFLTGRRLKSGLGVLRQARRFTGLGGGRFG